jgi:hypothetical protein
MRPHSKDPNTLIARFAPGQHVTARAISTALKAGAFRTMIWLQGYDFCRIGPHLIRVSGAMQLALTGHSDTMIKKIGRWTSNTWEMYLHSQILCLTRGVSQKMATPIADYNITSRAVH